MWSHEVTWQIKNIIPPPSQCLWSPNLSRWWHAARSSHPKICMTPKWSGLVRSRDKLNTLYLHLQKTHEHRNWLDLSWEVPNLKAEWPFDHVTIWKINISTFTRLMTTKLGMVLNLGKRFSTQTLKSSPTSCLESK